VEVIQLTTTLPRRSALPEPSRTFAWPAGIAEGRLRVDVTLLLPYSSDDSVVAGTSVPGRFWRRS
jgi:hypothetical protein